MERDARNVENLGIQDELSTIEDPELRTFLEGYLTLSPVDLNSPIIVKEAVLENMAYVQGITGNEEFKDLSKGNLTHLAKELSVHLQTKYLLRFEPQLASNGKTFTKTVSGKSTVALAAICYQVTMIPFMRESVAGGKYPHFDAKDLAQKINNDLRGGFFEGIVRTGSERVGEWRDDYHKREAEYLRMQTVVGIISEKQETKDFGNNNDSSRARKP